MGAGFFFFFSCQRRWLHNGSPLKPKLFNKFVDFVHHRGAWERRRRGKARDDEEILEWMKSPEKKKKKKPSLVGTSRHFSLLPPIFLAISASFICFLSAPPLLLQLSVCTLCRPCQAESYCCQPQYCCRTDTHTLGGRGAYKYFHITGIVKEREMDGCRGRTDGLRCSRGQSVHGWKRNERKIDGPQSNKDFSSPSAHNEPLDVIKMIKRSITLRTMTAETCILMIKRSVAF